MIPGKLSWYALSDGDKSFADEVGFDGRKIPSELLIVLGSEILERSTCKLCRAAASHEPVFERALKLYQASGDSFSCETFRLNRFSRGPVNDGELLNLFVSDHPETSRLGDGTIHPGNLARLGSGGVSVLRDGADDQEFQITLSMLAETWRVSGKEQSLGGVFQILSATCPILGERQVGCGLRYSD